MDATGRIAESEMDGAAGQPAFRRKRVERQRTHRGRMRRLLRRFSRPVTEWHVPRGLGIGAVLALLFGSLAFGCIRGGHGPLVIAQLTDVRDALANAFGFRIGAIALKGERQVSREEILARAGVTSHTSLLFLDATAARANLKANPWIAEATVLKLYPDQLHIELTERLPFALWQKDGQVAVIAEDGTVLDTTVPKGLADLPLMVGAGAETRAKDFLAVLDRYPAIRDQVRASVFVAERRWNLQLKNGVDVRLPENGFERALELLVRLDRDKKLLSRDINVVDMRLPDRVTVRLSDDAAQTREETQKANKPKRKGGDA